MKFIGVLLLCAMSFGVNAQEKQVDRNAQVAKLSTVQTEIVLLDEKIERIESRLAENPEQPNPVAEEELERLKAKRDKLKRIEFSVKAYLDDTDKNELKKSDDK